MGGSHMKSVEPTIAQVIENEGMDALGVRLPKISIEGRKAFDMFWNYRRRTFCDAHEPLIIGLDNKFQTCRCEFYNHFVGSRWLCLPCFFVEEAKTYGIKEHRIVGIEEGRVKGDPIEYVKVSESQY